MNPWNRGRLPSISRSIQHVEPDPVIWKTYTWEEFMKKEILKPGPELDALVAEEVMGIKDIQYTFNGIPCDGSPDYYYSTDRPEGYLSNPLSRYSTSIEAAWEVVEKFKDVEVYVNKQSNYPGFSCVIGDLLEAYAVGETAPHAICLAARKAVEDKEEE